MGGGKKGGGAPNVTDYFLAVDFGICHGEVDALTQITIDDREVWAGELTEQKTLVIYKPDLFGGPKKEGGVVGRIDFAPGGWDDRQNYYRAYMEGGDIDNTPQYRGTCNVFMRGLLLGEEVSRDNFDEGIGGVFQLAVLGFVNPGQAEGFYWSTNLANIKPAAFRVRREPKPPAPFPSNLRMISTELRRGLANPAAIILEVLTSDEFGMWAPVQNIDVDSFIECAQTLHDENFGLSFNWVKQDTIESFIGLILNHIAGVVFVSHLTGLVTMRLTRGGYNPETLPVLDPSNAVLETYKRRSWGETVNEVVVKWRNPENEQDETVSVQDGANIAMQGSLVSSSVDLPGIRSADLALRVAQRELQTQATPLANVRLQVNRSVVDIEPSGLFRLTWPDYGIDNMVFRVTRIDLGTLTDNKITIEAVEDVFGMPSTAIFEDPGTGWTDGSEQPRPALDQKALTVPYYFLANAIGETEAQNYEYPSALTGVLAVQDGADTHKFELHAEKPNNQGGVIKALVGEYPISALAEFTEPLPPEVVSVLTPINLTRLDLLVPGSYLLIEHNFQNWEEICLITDVSGVEITVIRGILDTVPIRWGDGARAWDDVTVWIFNDLSFAIDLTERTDGETAEYWVCPKTSLGTLDPEDAPVLYGEVNDRPYRPYRPGNVRVNGQLFPTELQETDLTITWAHRDKELETTQIRRFDEGNIGSPNVTYYIQIIDLDTSNIIKVFTDVTGTSISYPATQEAADTGKVAPNVGVWIQAVDPELGFIDGQSWAYVYYEFSRPVPLWSFGWGTGWGNDFE